jgi:hypothetical protein
MAFILARKIFKKSVVYVTLFVLPLGGQCLKNDRTKSYFMQLVFLLTLKNN